MEVAIEAAAQQDEEGRKAREFAEMIWKTSGITDNANPPPEWIDKERPFLPPTVKHTSQPLEAIQAALERDKFLSPVEARELGLIDEVVEHRPGREDSEKGFK